MSEDARVIMAMTWATDRLQACDRTMRTSSSRQSRDWAYGESVAIKRMLEILSGVITIEHGEPASRERNEAQAELTVLRKLADAVARWAKHDETNPLPALRHDAELLEAYQASTASPHPEDMAGKK